MRQIYSQKNPDYSPRDLEIWNCESKGITNPASIVLESSQKVTLILNIELSTDEAASGKTCKIFGVGWIVKLNDYEWKSEPFTFSDGAYKMSVPVTLTGYSTEVPWGFDEPFAWTVSVYSPGVKNSSSLSLGQTPIELYSLVSDLAPYYLRSGVPVEFLHSNKTDLVGWGDCNNPFLP